MENCGRVVDFVDGDFVICYGQIVTITDNGVIVEVCSKCGKGHSLVPDEMKAVAGPLYPQDDEGWFEEPS